jgi:hypothetical protein
VISGLGSASLCVVSCWIAMLLLFGLTASMRMRDRERERHGMVVGRMRSRVDGTIGKSEASR